MNEPHDLTPNRLERDPDGMIGGVAGGIADYFAIDPSIVRLAFLALTVFGGSGPFLYLAAWLVIPERPRDFVAS